MSKTSAPDPKLSRRAVLKAAAAGAVASVGPWVLSREALASSGTLNIMMWSDYLPGSFREKFTAKTGIEIKHTPYGSNEELLHKIRATKGSGFDLIGPTNDRGDQWRALDLLQTIDMNRVPVDKVLPSMLRMSEGFTWDGKPRHLPYLWGTEAMAWRTDKWSREYKDLSLGDLWLPEMRGKVMGRPHSMMAGIGRHLEAAGQLPPFTEAYKDEARMRRHWDAITRFAVEHKPWIKQFWNDAEAQKTGFMNNSVVLGQCWDGPPLRLGREGKPVVYMAPREGAFAWMDGLSIPVGASNLDAAYEFINFVFDAEVGGLLASETGYNSVSKGADQYLDDWSRKAFATAYPGDALARLWPWPSTPSWYASIRATYRNKFVAA